MRLAIPADFARLNVLKRVQDHAWGLGLVAVTSVALTASVATLAHDQLFHAGPRAATQSSAEAAAVEPATAAMPTSFDSTTTVVLAEGKFQSADIQTGAATVEKVAREVAVAGRVEADPNRRVVIHPKAPGVVRTLPVQPGTKVKAGDVLVILDSAEVATARLSVRERQRALSTARAEAAWKSAIAANTEAMIALLGKGASARDVTTEFADKLVGTSRGTLVSAWAELEMASHELDKQSSLNKQNIVGEHPVFIAEHTREGAQAKFAAVLEQVRFDVAQADRVARQQARNAEEMVIDAAEHLRILGVEEDIAHLLAHPETAADLPTDFSAVASYPIVAPLDGTIVSTTATRSSRVDMTNPLFVIADLSRVYTVANVPESDFALLPNLPGGTIRLTAEAYPGQSFNAKMLYTGAEVDPNTRTVRLVAEVDNPDDLLKLGMFARIALDANLTESATVVPPGALVDFDGVPTLFQPDPSRPRTFTRHVVKLGRATPEGQVVTSGIKPGDKIVVAGTFLLKSELILQNETDED